MAGNLSKRPLFPWINIPILHRERNCNAGTKQWCGNYQSRICMKGWKKTFPVSG
jgi:hypothetical protein